MEEVKQVPQQATQQATQQPQVQQKQLSPANKYQEEIDQLTIVVKNAQKELSKAKDLLKIENKYGNFSDKQLKAKAEREQKSKK